MFEFLAKPQTSVRAGFQESFHGFGAIHDQTNEIGYSLCRDEATGDLTHGKINVGTPTAVQIPIDCPPGSEWIGLAHTHPGGAAYPSAVDVRSAIESGAQHTCIIVPETGEVRCYDV